MPKASVNSPLLVPSRAIDGSATGFEATSSQIIAAPYRSPGNRYRIPIDRGRAADVIGQPWQSIPMAGEADDDGIFGGTKILYAGSRGFGRPGRLLRRPRTAFVYCNTQVSTAVAFEVVQALQALLDASFEDVIAPLGVAVVLAFDSSGALNHGLLSPALAETAHYGGVAGFGLSYDPSADPAYGGDVLTIAVRSDQFCDPLFADPYCQTDAFFDDGSHPPVPPAPAGHTRVSGPYPSGSGFIDIVDVATDNCAAHRDARALQSANFDRLRSVFYVASEEIFTAVAFDDIWAAMTAGDPQYELVRFSIADVAVTAQAIFDLIAAHFA